MSLAALKVERQKRIMVPTLAVVTAKDYRQGREEDLLKGVQNLLFVSMKILNHNVASTVDQASGWFWKSWDHAAKGNFTPVDIIGGSGISGCAGGGDEEKKCDMDDIKSNISGDMSPGELDGIVDSMGYVLEVMENYQQTVHKAAEEFLSDMEILDKTTQSENLLDEEVDNENAAVAEAAEAAAASSNRDGDCSTASNWENLKDIAKDMSNTDLLLGSLLSTQSGDEYPAGSEPLIPLSSTNPTADVFLGSLATLFTGTSTNNESVGDKGNLLTLDSKLQHLHEVQAVSEACTNQIHELDIILNNVQKVDSMESMETHNSVISSNIGGEATSHLQLGSGAATYIEAAREKLKEYTNIADNLLNDQVKCVVSEYSCSNQKYSDTLSTSSNLNAKDTCDEPTTYFEALQKHFSSDAYDNLDFKGYLQAEKDGKMQKNLLDILHSSAFIRNVSDSCKTKLRIHVGMELSVLVCNIIMNSLNSGRHEHTITEWGAVLFHKHVKVLHAYIYEFCCWTGSEIDDILEEVSCSTLDASPMDSNWERLFSTLNILKIDRLSNYEANMLHALQTTKDAQRILSLRAEFTDDAIRKVLVTSELSAATHGGLQGC